MGFLNKLKDAFTVSEENYFGPVGENPDDDDDYGMLGDVPPTRQGRRERDPLQAFADEPIQREVAKPKGGANVVNLSGQQSALSNSHVVFKKIDRFEDVDVVADVLNDKRIVILNLETCSNDISRRILDFLYGVTYANSGDVRRIAGRAYVLTPYNVPISGELLDEIQSSTSFTAGGAYPSSFSK